MILASYARGTFPPHFLYGATKLERHGITVVWHKTRLGLPRWQQMCYTAWQLLTCRERYDAVYATHYRGLEVIVLLRALHLFRKPIVVWHHQPIITAPQRLREYGGRLFYKGFDHLFFFSEALLRASQQTQKVAARRMSVAHWGMDIPSWADKEEASRRNGEGMVFVSSGKELRDIETLFAACNSVGATLEVFISERNGDMDYGSLLRRLPHGDNIHIHLQTHLAPYEIARGVQRADCVCICCHQSKYTVGLTTLVEALALGKPIICSRNDNYPFSVAREGCGIEVPYYDVAAWQQALTFMQQHPQEARSMGRRAQALAREQYNDSRCAADVAAVLLHLK